MRILITGTSNGIGKATAQLFLDKGHLVFGIDKEPSTIDHPFYIHYTADINYDLPEIEDVEVLINNAGVQNTGLDIRTNLVSLMRVTECYGMQHKIKSIVNVASTSAHNGAEFPELSG